MSEPEHVERDGEQCWCGAQEYAICPLCDGDGCTECQGAWPGLVEGVGDGRSVVLHNTDIPWTRATVAAAFSVYRAQPSPVPVIYQVKIPD